MITCRHPALPHTPFD